MKRQLTYGKKLLSLLVSLSLLTGLILPSTAMAVEGAGDVPSGLNDTCHQEHDEACGYIETRDEIPCTCGAQPDENGMTTHEEGCAYQPAVEGRPCEHTCAVCHPTAPMPDETTAPGVQPPADNGMLGGTRGATVSFSGSGTSTAPYIIASASDLANLAAAVNNKTAQYSGQYIKIADAADTSAWEPLTTPIGTGVSQAYFLGHFDGNGKVIKVNIAKPVSSGLDNNCAGLFGYVGSGATVKNVGVSGTVQGNDCVGGVAGLSEGTVTNCFSSATVTGNSNIGGVLGQNAGGTATGCFNTGAVSGSSIVGGVVGYNSGYVTSGGDSTYATTSNCYNTGTVGYTTTTGASQFGGVAGQNAAACTLKNCYNTGAVTGSTNFVGGVVGRSADYSYTKDCVALNLTITAPGASNIGRVGGAVCTENSNSSGLDALAAMTLNGATVTDGIGPTTKHGGPVTAESKLSEVFTGNGWTYFNTASFGDKTLADGLPVLQSMNWADQNPSVPVPLPSWVTTALGSIGYSYAEEEGVAVITLTAESVTMTGQMEIPKDTKVVIDLNGKTLNGETKTPAIFAGKDKDTTGVELTIKSTDGPGTLACSGSGLAVATYADAKITVDANSQIVGGSTGGVFLRGGTLTNRGAITGGSPNGNGAVILDSDSTTLYNYGTITGTAGTSAAKNGARGVSSGSGTINNYNGATIAGGAGYSVDTADQAGNGGVGVFRGEYSDGTLTIQNAGVIAGGNGGNAPCGKGHDESGSDADASAGTPGTGGKALSDGLSAAGTGTTAAGKGGVCPFLPAALYVGGNRAVPEGDGTIEKPYKTIQEALDGATGGEEIRILENLTVDATLTVDAAKTLTISSYTEGEGEPAPAETPWTVSRASTLTDTQLLNATSGKLTITNLALDGGNKNGVTAKSPLVQVSGEGVLTLGEGGYIQNNTNANLVASGDSPKDPQIAFNGVGGIRVGTTENKGGGTFILDGGVITGNQVAANNRDATSVKSQANGTGLNTSAAGILVGGSTAKFTMNSGEITNNTVASGKNCYVGGLSCMLTAEGNVQIHGGTISGNKGTTYGGILLDNSNNNTSPTLDRTCITITGGTITANRPTPPAAPAAWACGTRTAPSTWARATWKSPPPSSSETTRPAVRTTTSTSSAAPSP